MGSIKTSKTGIQTHWTDKLRKWKPDWQLPRNAVKQKKSSPGQQQLFADVAIGHLASRSKGKRSKP